jgi:2-keto-4-pentenoate hydratase
MPTANATQAAELLWSTWRAGERLATLPAELQPADRSRAYAIQAEIERLSGRVRIGWKIAATSAAGQAHIGVDGPLAGRMLAHRVYGSGVSIPLATNSMRVAEAEFAFRLAQPLLPQSHPYAVTDVIAAVGSVHPAIELPDSRYHDFVRVGALHLMADNACAGWFVLGEAVQVPWRTYDLVDHRVTLRRNGSIARVGTGANVLGDPRVALTWLANELAAHGIGLQVGEVVTTGTCLIPVEVAPGDRITADFGDFGCVDVAVL